MITLHEELKKVVSLNIALLLHVVFSIISSIQQRYYFFSFRIFVITLKTFIFNYASIFFDFFFCGLFFLSINILLVNQTYHKVIWMMLASVKHDGLISVK